MKFSRIRLIFSNWPSALSLVIFLLLHSCLLTAAEEPPRHLLEADGVRLMIDLPDRERGSYRGMRFDPSGIVSQAEWQGHTFFGPMKPGKPPEAHDNVSGTAEEFGMDEPVGYADAKPGDPFLKVGVGLLQKLDEEPYKFSREYPMLRAFPWEVMLEEREVVFRQEGALNEYGYRFEKRLRILDDRPGFMITRTLENTGTLPLTTDHYGHNIIRIDDASLGPAYKVDLPLPPTQPLPERYADTVELAERAVTFQKEWGKGAFFMKVLPEGGPAEEQHATVWNVATGAGIEVAGDRPFTRLVLYGESAAICPEFFLYFEVDPGKRVTWSTTYQFKQ